MQPSAVSTCFLPLGRRVQQNDRLPVICMVWSAKPASSLRECPSCVLMARLAACRKMTLSGLPFLDLDGALFCDMKERYPPVTKW